MRIIIIGAVAAGTSAAAKARRNNEDAQIVIYEKDTHISYSGCGMPYFLGGLVDSAEQLAPRDPAFFKTKYNVDIFIAHEVLALSPKDKSVEVKSLKTGEVFRDTYDKLVIATGARATMPPIKGIDSPHVFALRTMNDMLRIRQFMDGNRPQSALIVGAGFIGMELCENLHRVGIKVTLVEMLPQVTPGLDSDMAVRVQRHIEEKGVIVYTGVIADSITEHRILLSNGQDIRADMVIVATGVRPNTELAGAAGIELGVKSAIRVNSSMQTNDPDIYACGDCAECIQIVTGKPAYLPLGSTANKQGRIAGDSMTGGDLTFRGVLGTGIFRIFDLTVGQTGLSERDAKAQGYDVAIVHNIKPDKPEYMGGKEMVIKGIADKKSGRMLGVQIVGYEGVDKRLDVFVTAITYKAKAEDLFHLDLAYAPPFSTTKDPVMYTGMILSNAIKRGRELITAEELDTLMHSGEKYTLIDVREPNQYDKQHVDTAQSIPHARLREVLDTLDKNEMVVTYCNRGTSGNATQNILINKGFAKVKSLSGGHKQYAATHSQDKDETRRDE
ncbi:MAG: FAD-dependent oxidoreductase [Eubacteriales bacterium]|jgi:NADPH-dependent 2,4-dienoyl-CoA reductase/sulfur reductase-like enzyme/rhodanese-related sulfurtransferase|nr:FAD-dependent oxidoreductase [Eubacteriales bacterium]MDD4105007.1 FAD-dependent oxidoreductase [Eubacteriales bacterium]MDD4710999.1 FAD-dependent oxidoreductase [Eubacteriales bacterium]NLO16191.1 FAD-dependent oxidoreductase [Clostridiales bacterium]